MGAEYTLVLPVRGRPDHTRRWLRFAAESSLDAPAIIADGGAEEDYRAVAAELAELKPTSVRHERHDASGGRREFFARVARALEGVTTPYCALSANDDFPLKAGLSAAAAELRRRPELSSCGGASAGVLLSGAPRYELGAAPPEVVSETASGRVLTLLGDYSPTWYDLHRTDELRDSFRRLAAASVDDANLGELSQALLGAAAGGVGRLAEPLVLREIDAPGSDSGAVAAKAKDLLDEMCARPWSGSFDAFVSLVARRCVEIDACDPAQAGDEIRCAYAAYARKTLRAQSAPRRPIVAIKAALKRSLGDERWGRLKSVARGAARRSAAPEPLAMVDRFLAGWEQR